jgi:hypothetical protein
MQANKISAKLHYNEKENAFHHCNSRRVLRHAPWSNIHVFTDHKSLTFDTLKTQRVLCWHTNIEEVSPMMHFIESPHNILANNLSRLQHLVTLAQIFEGKKLVEPAEVSNKKKTKHISWIKNTLVYMATMSGNVLSVISTYLTPHIWMKIH